MLFIFGRFGCKISTGGGAMLMLLSTQPNQIILWVIFIVICSCERPQMGALKKETLILKAPLFWVIVWSRHLLFIQKIRKNKIQLHVRKFLEWWQGEIQNPFFHCDSGIHISFLMGRQGVGDDIQSSCVIELNKLVVKEVLDTVS